MHIQVGKQIVELLTEEPKASCGHGLSAAIGILMVIAIVLTMIMVKV